MIDKYSYTRTIYFRDTDAAGVVYFANLLAICHEAYEAALGNSGIDLRSFFSNPTAAIPIVHASVDFYRPLFCGDRVRVWLHPQILTPSEFEITFEMTDEMTEASVEPDGKGRKVAQALTRHVCIEPTRRCRQELPDEIVAWLQSDRPEPNPEPTYPKQTTSNNPSSNS
ncbi:MAG: thioesterase family protein [Cyanobacteriota bacterium]|nr:thioesterase family protein [Cyanobacteriota bacterium]